MISAHPIALVHLSKLWIPFCKPYISVKIHLEIFIHFCIFPDSQLWLLSSTFFPISELEIW